MKNVLITGGHGFVGQNLAVQLRERKDCTVSLSGRDSSEAEVEQMLAAADIVFHLAGVNRPGNIKEFVEGNTRLTERMCNTLRALKKTPKIVLASSTQAALENPYGCSKAASEDALRKFSAGTGAIVRLYRLGNLFGKWCRPNYNSVVATFCHNIAQDLPIQISDPHHRLELTHIGDVIAAFLAEMDDEFAGFTMAPDLPAYALELGDLAGRIQAFHDMRDTLTLPDFSSAFNKALYSTYLSYCSLPDLEQRLDIKADPRGSLAEFVKGPSFGQIFVSRTRPGITRGNHYHHVKTEKFFVVEGRGLIKMRSVRGTKITEFRVTGSEYQVVDIPPGYTHSITNIGETELITLFWSSEVFDPNRPDTFFVPVDMPSASGLT